MNHYLALSVAFIAVSLSLISCGKDPVADFSWHPHEPKVGEPIRFINLSKDAKSFSWNFGDMSIGLDTEPEHIYKSAGTYRVDLSAIKGLKSDEKTMTVTE